MRTGREHEQECSKRRWSGARCSSAETWPTQPRFAFRRDRGLRTGRLTSFTVPTTRLVDCESWPHFSTSHPARARRDDEQAIRIWCPPCCARGLRRGGRVHGPRRAESVCRPALADRARRAASRPLRVAVAAALSRNAPTPLLFLSPDAADDKVRGLRWAPTTTHETVASKARGAVRASCALERHAHRRPAPLRGLEWTRRPIQVFRGPRQSTHPPESPSALPLTNARASCRRRRSSTVWRYDLTRWHRVETYVYCAARSIARGPDAEPLLRTVRGVGRLERNLSVPLRDGSARERPARSRPDAPCRVAPVSASAGLGGERRGVPVAPRPQRAHRLAAARHLEPAQHPALHRRRAFDLSRAGSHRRATPPRPGVVVPESSRRGGATGNRARDRDAASPFLDDTARLHGLPAAIVVRSTPSFVRDGRRIADPIRPPRPQRSRARSCSPPARAPPVCRISRRRTPRAAARVVYGSGSGRRKRCVACRRRARTTLALCACSGIASSVALVAWPPLRILVRLGLRRCAASRQRRHIASGDL